MATNTQLYVQVLGPAAITLDGVSIGHNLNSTLKIPSSTVSGMTGLYGNASVAEFHVPENPMFEIEFAQVDLPIYAKAIQATTLSTSGASEVLEGGKIAGYRLTPIEITVIPNASEVATIRSLTLWKCIPVGEPQIVFGLEQQKLKATFKVIVDESKTDAEKFFRFGTVAVSPDTSAPTVSSQSTADGATGVAVAVAPTFTFNEALDESTVVGSPGAANAFIIAAAETSTQTPIAATVTYAPSTFIVTITPTSSLAGATQYNIILTTGIKNGSGVRFAGYKMDFTTT